MLQGYGVQIAYKHNYKIGRKKFNHFLMVKLPSIFFRNLKGTRSVQAMIRIEIKRGFISWSFLTIFLFATAIPTLYVIINILPVYPVNSFLEARFFNVFYKWIGMNSFSFETQLLYFLLPIFSSIPYASSYLLDEQTGFIKNIYSRTKKSSYLISKFISNFIVGGTAFFLPIIINLVIVSLILPSVHPEIVDGATSINYKSMWAELFYTHPYIYIFSYAILNFGFGGLFATVGLACSVFVNRIFVVILCPFILYLFLFFGFQLTGNPALIPFKYLIPGQPVRGITLSIVLIQFFTLLIISTIVFFGGIRKREIY